MAGGVVSCRLFLYNFRQMSFFEERFCRKQLSQNGCPAEERKRI